MAFEAALIHFPTELVEIPPYKQAAFYVQLTKFLCGETVTDPRESHTQGRARTVEIEPCFKFHFVLVLVLEGGEVGQLIRQLFCLHFEVCPFQTGRGEG